MLGLSFCLSLFHVQKRFLPDKSSIIAVERRSVGCLVAHLESLRIDVESQEMTIDGWIPVVHSRK